MRASGIVNSWILAGTAALALTLIAPTYAPAQRGFSAVMVQHMALMDVVAPLLVLGFGNRLRPGGAGARLAAPAVAAFVHALVLWGWHAPVVYTAAGEGHAGHLLMKPSFLIAGLVFWRSALVPSRADGFGFGASAFWMFMTVMHTGLLGAVITFAPQPHYRLAGATVTLADQQLAGLVMWIGGTLVYTIAGVALTAAWLRRLERRSQAETT